MAHKKNTLPNTFLIGAPKSGTTALASWLGEHPAIFIPRLKEPNYFSKDIPGGITCLASYSGLFRPASKRQSVVMDASTQYLRSSCAVPELLKLVPDAKFVVLLRNPIEMAQSWHQEMLFNLEESETDFETAWNLQAPRLEGGMIPKTCRTPADLQYKEVCAIGRQLFALLEHIERDRVSVMFFDDLCRNPRQVYQCALNHLGLQDDGRVEFPVVNRAKVHRSRALAIFSLKVARFKARMGIASRFGVLEYLRQYNRKEQDRSELSRECQQQLQTTFEEDIAIIEKVTGRNLDSWSNA